MSYSVRAARLQRLLRKQCGQASRRDSLYPVKAASRRESLYPVRAASRRESLQPFRPIRDLHMDMQPTAHIVIERNLFFSFIRVIDPVLINSLFDFLRIIETTGADIDGPKGDGGVQGHLPCESGVSPRFVGAGDGNLIRVA